ncbi:MAG: NAD regulator [Pseudomonadota bacterium]
MSRGIRLELSAVLVALEDRGTHAVPQVLLAPGPDLPNRAFDPDEHRTLELSLRDWVSRDTGLHLAHVEQLYTFGDRAREAVLAEGAPHLVSIGYLAIVPMSGVSEPGPNWRPWTQFFPWEDRREGTPPVMQNLLPRLEDWAGQEPSRIDRVSLSFGLRDAGWRDELVLERYELLYEARLVHEYFRDRRRDVPADLPAFGLSLPLDHRRILATGIGRLRAKLKYRPVLFELLSDTFTLFDLQTAAEAVSGQLLHKQNFRRMILQSGLIEPTGGRSTRRGGRPASEYRLAADAGWERRVSPVRFGGARR